MLQPPRKFFVEDPILNLCVEGNVKVSVGFLYTTVLQPVMHSFVVRNNLCKNRSVKPLSKTRCHSSDILLPCI